MRYFERVNMRLVLLSLAAVLLLAGVAGVLYVRSIEARYDQAREQADVVRSRVGAEGEQPQLADLPQLTADLNQLEDDLRELDDQVDLPILGGIARNTPYLGDKLKASQHLLSLGIELTTITRDASLLANEVREAFEANGFMGSEPAVGPTWLEVVDAHQEDIYELERRYSAAIQQRETLDVDNLPGRALNTLNTLDDLLVRATSIRDEYFHLFPLLNAAFGGQQDARYLVLLQNGQELRMAGGFPGTYAMITVSDGRIASLEIEPIGVLNAAYADARPEVLPAPGPINAYLEQTHWLPHDAGWSPDFPEVAATLFSMYETTGWSPVSGIIAVNDDAVGDVLEIIGAYEIEIEGAVQEVNAENFLDLIQSYRSEGRHKEVVGILGDSLIEQVRATDFDTKKEIFFTLRDASNRRELQVAMREPDMQAEVVSRGWDGAIYPDPEIPTLAMAAANVTGNKVSENIFATSRLEITQATPDAPLHARWQITFDHQGDPDGPEEYEGFHRTWIQVYLPPGASVTATSQAPEPAGIVGDDRALGFHVGLITGEQEVLEIEFDLPAGTDQLLLRRQSGMNDVGYVISGDAIAGCALNDEFQLDRDYLVAFDACDVAVFNRTASASR